MFIWFLLSLIQAYPIDIYDRGIYGRSYSFHGMLPMERLATIDFNYNTQFQKTGPTIFTRFFDVSHGKLNNNDAICSSSYTEPSVWELAVSSKALILTGDQTKANAVLSNLYAYENTQLGAFSASTAGDTDIYNDDNCQIMWSFIEGYILTKNQQYLNSAQSIMNYLKTQTDSNGGVIWHYQNPYIASISTIEVALAAMRLHEITGDTSLLDFARKSVNFMFTYFQDPGDKLFYDGLNKDDYSNINKGKLSYTVGACLSTLVLLQKYDNSWGDRIVELANAATNVNGAFYTGDGVWNNDYQYSHLLFVGLTDIIKNGYPQYKSSVMVQGNYIMNFLKDDTDNLFFGCITSASATLAANFETIFNHTVSVSGPTYCNNVASKSLMQNGSIGQILYHLAGIN